MEQSNYLWPSRRCKEKSRAIRQKPLIARLEPDLGLTVLYSIT